MAAPPPPRVAWTRPERQHRLRSPSRRRSRAPGRHQPRHTRQGGDGGMLTRQRKPDAAHDLGPPGQAATGWDVSAASSMPAA
jgi:hypothetical protein